MCIEEQVAAWGKHIFFCHCLNRSAEANTDTSFRGQLVRDGCTGNVDGGEYNGSEEKVLVPRCVPFMLSIYHNIMNLKFRLREECVMRVCVNDSVSYVYVHMYVLYIRLNRLNLRQRLSTIKTVEVISVI